MCSTNHSLDLANQVLSGQVLTRKEPSATRRRRVHQSNSREYAANPNPKKFMLESIEPTDNPLAKKRKYTCGKCQGEGHRTSACSYMRFSCDCLSENHDPFICRIIKEHKSTDLQPPRRHTGKARPPRLLFEQGRERRQIDQKHQRDRPHSALLWHQRQDSL